MPYESGIAGEGLVPGKSMLVYGLPEKKAKRFNINLLKKNGDIALHLNSRFDEKAMVHLILQKEVSIEICCLSGSETKIYVRE